MQEDSPAPLDPAAAALRARLAADLAAGKTIVLGKADLARPDLRQNLPRLLDDLARTARGRTAFGVEVPGYTLLGEIGHGGQSTVHLARHLALGRHVALKIAPKWLGADERTQQRLLQEARAMARVSHPHIVAIHDIVDVGDTVAIAMEWIDGMTLAGLLATLREQPADDDLALLLGALGTSPAAAAKLERTVVRCFVRMLHDVAVATHCVHEAGLLHLDIKPSNVLVRRDGTALLADFGVVREKDVAATHTRTFAGTPVYAAPEQLRRDDAAIGPRTDVYALGMTLYESIARRQPLQHLDLTGILTSIQAGRIPPLSQVADVAPDLANIVHKAMAPEWEHRYPTAQALADDLRAFLEHRPVSARPLTRLQHLRRFARNEPWKAALAGALLVLLPLLLGVGGYLLSQWSRLEAMQLAERREQASELRQAAYQGYFMSYGDEEWASATLRRAMELDGETASLACLLAMAHEDGSPQLAHWLTTHAVGIAGSAGLRQFAAKVADRRAFFTDDEVAAFASSHDPTDRLVVALDRVFWSDDRCTTEAYAMAHAELVAAAMVMPNDPLVFGLQAWAAARAENRDAVLAVERALVHRWPDAFETTAWRVIAWEALDPALALRLADEQIARRPDDPRSYELRLSLGARDLGRRSSHGDTIEQCAAPLAATMAALERAVAAGLHAPSHAAQATYSLLYGGRLDLVRQRLADPTVQLPPHHRMRLLGSFDRETLLHAADAAIAAPRPRPSHLVWLHDRLDPEAEAERLERLWQKMHEVHPDRRLLHADRLGFLYGRGRLQEAKELARDVCLPREGMLANGVVITALLAQARDWSGLLAHAERWRAHADTPSLARQAASHAGLALARLGDPIRAAEQLADALVVVPDKGKWFGYALVEDAWLRVMPNGPAELRDPELAKLRIARLDAFNEQLEKPVFGMWTLLVRAEVAFANGDAAGARETLARCRRLSRAREPHAPDELDDLVRSAAARYGS
jgi:serine/threonine protein kinase